MPKILVYIVHKFTLECIVLFYGSVIAVVFSLTAMVHHSSSTSARGLAAVVMPYVEAQPHGAPAEASLASSSLTPLADGTSMWPMHGIVTTEFGAPDYPYQGRHTGIDISSARPAGVSQVHAFRAGTVIAVIHSYSSYGNHVIIDHGGGLTSLYGHLYSISVSQGQQIHAGDVVGKEGSTGASTGPHVHFETDLNGVPQNPRHYLAGNP